MFPEDWLHIPSADGLHGCGCAAHAASRSGWSSPLLTAGLLVLVAACSIVLGAHGPDDLAAGRLIGGVRLAVPVVAPQTAVHCRSQR